MDSTPYSVQFSGSSKHCNKPPGTLELGFFD